MAGKLIPIAFESRARHSGCLQVPAANAWANWYTTTMPVTPALRWRTFWGGGFVDSVTPATEEQTVVALRADFVYQGRVLSSLRYSPTLNGNLGTPYQNPPTEYGIWPTFAVAKPATRAGGARGVPCDTMPLPGESIVQHFDNGTYGAAGFSRFLVMSPFRFTGEIDEVRFSVDLLVEDNTMGVETWWGGAFCAIKSGPDPI